MLSRASKKFDAAFSALPPETRQRILLAMYRAAPAFAQYQRDLEAIGNSPEMTDAIWDVVIALGMRLAMKGRDGIKQKQLDEMREAAPVAADFFATLHRMLAGMIPGLGPVVDVGAAPAIAERAALPPVEDAAK